MAERHVTHAICSHGFAGVERYVSDTVTELVRRGWSATVIGGDLTRMRAALPESVLFIPARTAAQVSEAIWRSRTTPVLHTHMTAAEAAALPLKGLCFDRWITTCHFARPRGSSALGRAVAPLIRSRVDAQIAISRFVADSIDGPSVVIHNGVPASTEPPRLREQTVVMMQRLEREKDTETGLRAWALSGLADRGWRLRIFGRGSHRSSLERLTGELGITASVRFEGFVDHPRRMLAEAGIVLATAPAEPFGLSVLEAMAEAAPIVAADGGAHRETLTGAGILFRPGDAGDAAQALAELAVNPAARERCGRALCERFTAEFLMDRHAAALEAVYAGAG